MSSFIQNDAYNGGSNGGNTKNYTFAQTTSIVMGENDVGNNATITSDLIISSQAGNIAVVNTSAPLGLYVPDTSTTSLKGAWQTITANSAVVAGSLYPICTIANIGSGFSSRISVQWSASGSTVSTSDLNLNYTAYSDTLSQSYNLSSLGYSQDPTIDGAFVVAKVSGVYYICFRPNVNFTMNVIRIECDYDMYNSPTFNLQPITAWLPALVSPTILTIASNTQVVNAVNSAVPIGTGCVTFAGLSYSGINVTVGAGSGYILGNALTYPPLSQKVSWNATTATFVFGVGATWIYAYTTGSASFSFNTTSTRPSASFKRQNIVLGVIYSYNGTTIAGVFNTPTMIESPNNALRDLTNLSYNPKNGFTIAGTGTLAINIGAGTVYGQGFNCSALDQNPDFYQAPAVTTAPIYLATQTTVAPASVTLIPSSQYNPSGSTLSALPATQYTNHRLFWIPDTNPSNTNKGQYILQYGQVLYTSQSSAQQAIAKENFNLNPFLQGAVLIGAITVISGASATNNTAQVFFTYTGVWGDFIGSGGLTSVSAQSSLLTFTMGRYSSSAVASSTGVGIPQVGDGTLNAPKGFSPIRNANASTIQGFLGTHITSFGSAISITINLRYITAIPSTGLAPTAGSIVGTTTFTTVTTGSGESFSISGSTSIPANSYIWLEVIDSTNTFNQTSVAGCLSLS
jgi:hypothetical protein